MKMVPGWFKILVPALVLVLLLFATIGRGWFERPGARLAALAAPPSLQGYNVIVIVIDALRASALGSYGYERNTTPFLDSLAAEGTLFLRASSTSSFTRESVASMFTGKLPSSGGATGWGARPAPGNPTLARLFQEAGYRTGLVSNSVMLGHAQFRRGFEVLEYPGEGWSASGGGVTLTRSALEFVRSSGEDKFFLYMHYFDPHGPYEPDTTTLARFTDKPYASPLKLYGNVREWCSELRADGFGAGDERFEDLRLRYDAEVAMTDAAIHEFFDGLKEAGLLERTLIIVTSDHGEEFLEHDYVEHAWTLYDESLHVPLIFWAPGRLGVRRIEGAVSLVDLMPTLLSLFEMPVPPGDGRAMLEASAGAWAPVQGSQPLYAELLIQTRNLLHGVTLDDWKYIAAQKWMETESKELAVRNKQAGPSPRGEFQDVDPWGPVIREELYHLADDPEESRNLAGKQPAVLEKMRGLMDAYRLRCQGQDNSRARPKLTEEDRLRLESLGY